MSPQEVESIEIDLLLEAIFRRYGYDFRRYARASIERRVRLFLSQSGGTTIAEMIPRLLRDADFFARMAQYFSVPVTEMFRDPFVYQALRRQIIPLLRTWPHVKIWHAGCASGEEIYSLAILLREEGLYERVTIYATDFNDTALAQARAGIYSLEKIRDATRNYQLAGGQAAFSDYYHAGPDAAVIDADLRRRITFANHNLAVDQAFGDMHLILCRNVLIYFNRELQNHSLELFRNSLVNGGFLCLGSKEDLAFSSVAGHFKTVDAEAKIYKKIEAAP